MTSVCSNEAGVLADLQSLPPAVLRKRYCHVLAPSGQTQGTCPEFLQNCPAFCHLHCLYSKPCHHHCFPPAHGNRVLIGLLACSCSSHSLLHSATKAICLKWTFDQVTFPLSCLRGSQSLLGKSKLHRVTCGIWSQGSCILWSVVFCPGPHASPLLSFPQRVLPGAHLLSVLLTPISPSDLCFKGTSS